MACLWSENGCSTYNPCLDKSFVPNIQLVDAAYKFLNHINFLTNSPVIKTTRIKKHDFYFFGNLFSA